MIRVAVDAMGGDYAPDEMIRGAVEAVNRNDNIAVLLVGQEQIIRQKLTEYTYPADRIQIVNATEVISNDEVPTLAIRRKKDSSIVVGMNLVKSGLSA